MKYYSIVLSGSGSKAKVIALPDMREKSEADVYLFDTILADEVSSYGGIMTEDELSLCIKELRDLARFKRTSVLFGHKAVLDPEVKDEIWITIGGGSPSVQKTSGDKLRLSGNIWQYYNFTEVLSIVKSYNNLMKLK